MKKLAIASVIVFVALMAFSFYGVFIVGKAFFNGGPLTSVKPVPVGDPPVNSLVVFNFAPKGDAAAKTYAIGFARALSDRLYCAPTCVTFQPNVSELSDQVAAYGGNYYNVVSQDVARKVTKALGARYYITGDFELKGNKATVRVTLTDTMSNKLTGTSKTGTLSQLPDMQAEVVDAVIYGMKLKPDSREMAELRKANFSHPATLDIYGKSVLVRNPKETEKLRWQAVESDPNSLFATLRLLEYYRYGPVKSLDLINNSKLVAFLSECNTRYPDNTQIGTLNGWLIYKQYRYKEAQAVLDYVTTKDAKAYAAYDALFWVANSRRDAKKALLAAEAAEALWSTHPCYHADMAIVCDMNAYTGSAPSDLDSFVTSFRRAVESSGRENNALREAYTAVKINPNSSFGWMQVLRHGSRADRKNAFDQLMRVDKLNWDAYEAYANTLPEWGPGRATTGDVYALAAKNFGEGSAEDVLLRGWVELWRSAESLQKQEKVLQLANEAIGKSKTPNEIALRLKCRVLWWMKRRDEMAQVAREGFALCPSPRWRFFLAKADQYLYQDRGQVKALDESAELLKVYVEEVPYDPTGHIEYGWCLSHQGKRDEARRQFEKALEIDPGNQKAKEKMKYVQ